MSEWIKWDGGERPVPPETIVEVELRSGDKIGSSGALTAQDWDRSPDFPDDPPQWEHHGFPDDIIAYRVLS